jgi:hypothetical protein
VSPQKKLSIVGGLALSLIGVSLIPLRALPDTVLPPRVEGPTFQDYSAAPLKTPLALLFMHHAVGAHILADPGTGLGQHPEGGGARRLLQENGYSVHSATFGSTYGEHNFIYDWLPKFEGHMDELLRIEDQDRMLPEPQRNRVVLFKSCFDNSRFTGEGVEPGDPRARKLTLANAKAAFRALLPVLKRRPETLFVFITTPPLALPKAQPLGKVVAKRVLGRPTADQNFHASALLARKFHDWIVAKDGWLADGDARNIAVFDLYDILTKQGTSLFLEYPTGDGTDNHPSLQANQQAAKLLVPFLNRAARRAQLAE